MSIKFDVMLEDEWLPDTASPSSTSLSPSSSSSSSSSPASSSCSSSSSSSSMTLPSLSDSALQPSSPSSFCSASDSLSSSSASSPFRFSLRSTPSPFLLGRQPPASPSCFAIKFMLSSSVQTHLDCTKAMTFRDIRKLLLPELSLLASQPQSVTSPSSSKLLTDLLGSEPAQSLFSNPQKSNTPRISLFEHESTPHLTRLPRDVFATSKLLDSLIGDFADEGIFHSPISSSKKSLEEPANSKSRELAPNVLLDSLLGDFSEEGVFQAPLKPSIPPPALTILPAVPTSLTATTDPPSLPLVSPHLPSTPPLPSAPLPTFNETPVPSSLLNEQVLSPSALSSPLSPQTSTECVPTDALSNSVLVTVAPSLSSQALSDTLADNNHTLIETSTNVEILSEELTASSLVSLSASVSPTSSSHLREISIPPSDPSFPSPSASVALETSTSLSENPALAPALESSYPSVVSLETTLDTATTIPSATTLSTDTPFTPAIAPVSTTTTPAVTLHVPSALHLSLEDLSIHSQTQGKASPHSSVTDLSHLQTPSSSVNHLHSLLGTPSDINKMLPEDEEDLFSLPPSCKETDSTSAMAAIDPSSPSFSSCVPSPSASPCSSSAPFSSTSSLPVVSDDSEWVRRTQAAMEESKREETAFYLDPTLNVRIEGVSPQIALTQPVTFEETQTVEELLNIAEKGALDTRSLCVSLGLWTLDHVPVQQVVNRASAAPPLSALSRTGLASTRRSFHTEDPFGQSLMSAFQKGIDCFLKLETQYGKMQRRGERNRNQRTEVAFPFENTKYQLVSYCDDFFERVRARFSMTYSHFLTQLSSSNGCLCGGKSDGQSNAYIYTTNGNSFIVKSLRGDEPRKLKTLITSAPYYSHLVHHPHTLLPRLFGLFQIVAPTFERWIMVANNVFDTAQCEVHRIYDLKGSTLFRRGTLRPQRTIFKDQDAIDMQWRMRIGSEARARLLQTLLLDVQFLESQNVMDYSLLVGVHDLQEDSAMRFYSPESGGPIVCSSETEIFFVGVIDILQDYNAFKMVESGIKALMYSKRDYSCVSPDLYAQRFMNFISSIVH